MLDGSLGCAADFGLEAEDIPIPRESVVEALEEYHKPISEHPWLEKLELCSLFCLQRHLSPPALLPLFTVLDGLLFSSRINKIHWWYAGSVRPNLRRVLSVLCSPRHHLAHFVQLQPLTYRLDAINSMHLSGEG